MITAATWACNARLEKCYRLWQGLQRCGLTLGCETTATTMYGVCLMSMHGTDSTRNDGAPLHSAAQWAATVPRHCADRTTNSDMVCIATTIVAMRCHIAT